MKKGNSVFSVIRTCIIIAVIILLCISFFAKNDTEPVNIVAFSDFQDHEGHNAGAEKVNKLLRTVQHYYPKMDAILFAGDYHFDYDDSEGGFMKLREVVHNVYGTSMDEIYIQGNHDDYSMVGPYCTPSGQNDTDSFGVFVINEKDYMWYNDDEIIIQETASNLKKYLDAKRMSDYSKPIFVISHLPLHFSMRTLVGGNDGMHANYIFDVLNEGGNAGLNIIFLFGHNHSNGWDDYLGGSAIFLTKGDKINIAQNSTSVFEEETLAFTYMNAGYIGYYGDPYADSMDKLLTMTTFTITDDEVSISRFDSSGFHDLKSSGVYNTVHPDEMMYSADIRTVKSPYTIVLNTDIIKP